MIVRNNFDNFWGVIVESLQIGQVVHNRFTIKFLFISIETIINKNKKVDQMYMLNPLIQVFNNDQITAKVKEGIINLSKNLVSSVFKERNLDNFCNTFLLIDEKTDIMYAIYLFKNFLIA